MGMENLGATDYIEVTEYNQPRPDLEIPQEDIFKVLSNDRRRCTIHFLKHHENEMVSLREIVDYVAAWENNIPIERVDSNARKCVYTALRQSHLPKLDDLGVIEYDHLRGEARLTEAAEEVQMYMEYVPINDIPWHQYYLGLSIIVSVLAGLTWAGVYPFNGLPWETLAAIVIGILFVSAVVQTVSARQRRLGADAMFSIDQ